MNNRICRYLAHSSTADIEKAKGLRRNAISDLSAWSKAESDLGAKEGKATTQEKINESKLYAKSSDSNKALANHEWYMHNQDKKKEYNKAYYQANKDYWERRYNEAKGKLNSELDYSSRTGDYSNQNTTKFNNLSVESDISKQNYDRAVKEYDDFMKNNPATYMPVSNLSNKKSIIDRGVNLFASIVKPITGLLAAIFGSK